MKRLLCGIAMCLVLGAECATMRYWIGGDGNWSDTSHWKGGVKPSNGDPVQFSASLGSVTVTMDEDSADLKSISLEDQAGGDERMNCVTITGNHRIGQGENMSDDCTVGNGRKLILDGAQVDVSSSIYVGTNAVFELRSGSFITRRVSASTGVCLRQGAKVNITGGRMSISAVVNDSKADEGGSNSIFRVAGGSVEIFCGDAFSSHFHPEWTEFLFDGGEIVANQRLDYAKRCLLPPKGSSFISSYAAADCEGECKDVADGVYEVGGSVALTNRESAYVAVSAGGTSLVGGGSLAVPRLTFNVYESTASLDLSAINLGTSIESGALRGNIFLNDGLALGCWNDIAVGGNKESTFNVVGPLKIDTLDCFDRTTPHAVQLQQWFNFSQMTDFETTGGGSTRIVSKTAAVYLHDFKVGAGTTLDVSSSAKDKIVTDRLILESGSILKVGANIIDVAVSFTVAADAEIHFAFDALEGGKLYPVWFGPQGTEPPVSNFLFDTPLPSGWQVVTKGTTAYLGDGTVIGLTDAQMTTRCYWMGVNGGLWNDSGNWTLKSGNPYVPGNNVSDWAYFAGNRQLSVTNDYPKKCWFRNLIAQDGAGPYTISGNPIYMVYPNSWGLGNASVQNLSSFPLMVESQLQKEPYSYTKESFFYVAADTEAPIVMTGGGNLTNAVFAFHGDVRVGGTWDAIGLYPYGVGGRVNRLTLLPGADFSVFDQGSNQTVKAFYHICNGAVMTVAGQCWVWSQDENIHFVDGELNVSCPMQTAARQTFRGAGVINLACARSDMSAASEFKFADSVTVRPASWITVRDGADNPLRMFVRDNVTIGASADWSYGAAVGFASETDATNRALTVEGGAKSTVVFDTEGYSITLTDPIAVSRYATVKKRGAGSLVLESDKNVFNHTTFRVEGGDLVLNKPQAFWKISFAEGTKVVMADEMMSAAEKGWTTVFTAVDLVGDVNLGDKYKLNVVPVVDGFGVVVRAKARRGLVLVVR